MVKKAFVIMCNDYPQMVALARDDAEKLCAQIGERERARYGPGVAIYTRVMDVPLYKHDEAEGSASNLLMGIAMGGTL